MLPCVWFTITVIIVFIANSCLRIVMKIGLEKCCASTISWKIWHAASNKNKFLMPNNELISYPNKLISYPNKLTLCPNKLFGHEVSLFLLLMEDKWTTKAVRQNTDLFCINQSYRCTICSPIWFWTPTLHKVLGELEDTIFWCHDNSAS